MSLCIYHESIDQDCNRNALSLIRCVDRSTEGAETFHGSYRCVSPSRDS